MNAFTIRDLENLSGIKAHTIRIWEQRYSFLRPQRTDTNIRYYSNDELKTVLNIALLNKYGYKISHIDRMNPEEICDKIISLNSAEAQQERVINDLIQKMIDMDILAFEQVLNKNIHARGIEKVIIQLIFPFLEKIGILWQTGNVNPAQEHLVTNIIRQKLIVGIETTVSRVAINKTFLLFLPEGEHHELGLLFLYYLLKSRGAQTIYLGANVPMKDVEYVAKLKSPDVIYVHLTSASQRFNLEKFIQTLSQKSGQALSIISGELTSHYKKRLPSNVFFKKSLGEVMEYLSGI
jgi:MerR family transcriptional regulator, light-induced transcriptional regulator